MWIVRLALRRPYTFVVMAMLIVILGVVAITNMSTDIFPTIDIPICSVVWNYSGLIPEEMERRLISNYERALYSTVNDIEHVESQTINGMSVVRVFFQPGAHVEQGIAQVTAISQAAIRQAPPGTTPPLILRFSASNVQILQLGLGSDSLSEQELFDIANNFLRTDMATVPGAMVPWPYGGKVKQVQVDLDPDKLYSWGVSPNEVSTALNNQSVILPTGTAKMGMQEFPILINNTPGDVHTPDAVAELNEMPIKTVVRNGQPITVKVKDVGYARMGFPPQTSIVHADGKRGALLPILKSPEASTLSIVKGVRDQLPISQSRLSPALKVTPMFDQSVFVRASVQGVVKEGVIAAMLTGLMILLFLGSWRSTLIVVVSIPLSILVSIITLWALGQTLNVMTLGGMALAVGILVDDATVEIENIHRNLHQRKRLVQAILDGASQIAVPAFVSTLCICIVFTPVAFISGASRFLFTPMALAVVFAMLTSYLLSRTLVPTMVHYLLAGEVQMYGGVDDPDDPHLHPSGGHAPREEILGWAKGHRRWIALGAGLVLIAFAMVSLFAPNSLKAALAFVKENWIYFLIGLVAVVGFILAASLNLIWPVHNAFNRLFEKFRRVYGGFLMAALEHKLAVVSVFSLFVLLSCLLLPFIGRDFFPQVDAGQIRLHVRCPPGTRVEETERYFARVEDDIRTVIPKHEVKTVLDNMGIPVSSINLSMGDPSMMSSADGEIMISLSEDHGPTANYVKELRKKLPKDFPNMTFFFLPADITTQVLNFGLPAPIDIQIEGSPTQVAENDDMARRLMAQVRGIPGAVDVHIHQTTDVPELKVNVDRVMANQLGITQHDVGDDMLVTLSGSGVVAPNYYVDPHNGVQYLINVQTPQLRVQSIQSMNETTIMAGSSTGAALTSTAAPQLVGNVSGVTRLKGPANITHYNVHPTFDVLAGVQGTDLASVSAQVDKILAWFRNPNNKAMPRGTTVTVRGQVQSMNAAFTGLGLGLVFAVVLVYLLMAVNFQSWLDPLIILMALPGALAGILWMLFATRTTLSVPSLMGAIMAIGVATANSILMITFANDQRKEGLNAHDAALAAGLTRLRPVVMTALAMIIGMLPMSLGLGEGGEQNAPLGRAVIGGLLLATFSTLFFVPIVYSVLRQKAPETRIEPELRQATDGPHEPRKVHE